MVGTVGHFGQFVSRITYSSVRGSVEPNIEGYWSALDQNKKLECARLTHLVNQTHSTEGLISEKSCAS